MKVTSSFECGNGKGIEEIVPGHFRFYEVGEQAPYCKYFCVRVEAEGDGGRVRLDVYPDPDLGEAGRVGMMGHYPSQIWFSTNNMTRWKPVENVLERVSRFHETHLSVEVPVAPESAIHVASNPVITYTHLLGWAQSLAAGPSPCRVDTIGRSFEGRDLPVLHLPAREQGARRVFVLAGQHPSEHCGVYAAMGMAEFLTSSHPEARRLRQACEFFLCPMVNVDGNANGRNGWTMQDVNMYGDFGGVLEGRAPAAVENGLLWRWLAEEVRPELSVHFHGYMGKKGFIDPPYDGLYFFPEPEAVYGDEAQLAAYLALRDTLIWDTDGATGGGDVFGRLDETTVEWQLARNFGTVPAFYEINHGYHGVWASKRKGAAVLRAALRAYLEH